MKKNHILFKALSVLIFLVGFSTQLSAQNYALKMSTADQAVLFDATDLNIGSVWTAEMWVRRDAQSNFSTLIDGFNSKFTLETWQGNNAWQYKVGFSKKGTGDQQFNYIAPIGEWVHLAYTCNGSSVTLYVNGEAKGTINQAIDIPLKGFGLLANPNESPKATIDEVRYWRRVLTADEIKAGMNQSVDISAPDLVSYWYFDDRAAKISNLSEGPAGTNKGATYVLANNDKFTSVQKTMTFKSIECFHSNEYLLKPGARNQELLGIKITTEGILNPLLLTRIVVNLNGTSQIADIEKVGITTTGKSGTFAPTPFLGTKQEPAARDLTFAGATMLKPGANYFWVVVDLNSTAAKGNVFDAELVSATIRTQTVTPEVGNPVGNREIADEVLAPNTALGIVPKPTSLSRNEMPFTLNAQTKIKYNQAEILPEAEYLKDFLNIPTGFSISASQGAAESNSIVLNIISDTELGEEGYTLQTKENQIIIEANKRKGLFWGIQTLRQLFATEIESKVALTNITWSIPGVDIKDIPRFEYRGMHLDVCRHFFPPSFVKKYIDLLAMYKINKFHWHLTEDQGWRIEIKKYPKLQTIAAFRNCSDVGENYGGFYTQEEVKDIVAYAAKKHITIIPEFEMPGHAVAVLTAYPEFACTSAKLPFTVRCEWGVSKDIFCSGKESTFEFIEGVLDEMVPLFPGEYFHIGGDEAPKDNWKTCTDCQRRKTELGLANEEMLQKYFVERVSKYLTAKNKKVIGWSEITHGGVPEGAIVQDWLNAAKTTVAAGNQVIMSNNVYMYLDYKQAEGEQGAYWATLPLSQVYNFEPVPGNFTAEEAKLLLGVEATMWTEYCPTERDVEYMLLPRMLAVSEIAWLPREQKNEADFNRRLNNHFRRFDLMGYSYRRSVSAPTTTRRSIEACEPITLTAEVDGLSYYWNNEEKSTSKSITVSESGTYKCYVNYYGNIIESVFDVNFKSAAQQPVVGITTADEQEISVLGDFDAYNWYTDGVSEYPFARGSSLNLPTTVDVSKYQLSGVQFTNSTKSLKLDGVDDVVEISQSDFLNNTKAYTFESWVKVNSWKNTWDVVMNKRVDNNNRVGMELGNSQGQIYVHVCNGNNTYGSFSGFPVNEWVHVAVVYDGTKVGNSQRLKFYMNGAEKTLAYTGTIPAATPTISNPLTLGHTGQNPAIQYADLRFWNTARTAEQLAENMNGLKTYGTDLHLYYPMNNLSTTTFSDVTKGVSASLKNATENYVSPTSAPSLQQATCESQRWQVSEIVSGLFSSYANDLDISISPNPSNGKVNIKGQLDNTEEINLRVYNLNSQLIYSQKWTSSEINESLDLSNKQEGVYLISVTAGGKSKIEKLILK